MINDKADEVTKRFFKSLLNRYQNYLEKLIKGSEFVFHYVHLYCIVNVKKIRIVMDNLQIPDQIKNEKAVTTPINKKIINIFSML